MTRKSTRLHQFKQRFERSAEVLQRTRQAGRQQQRTATRQSRMNANRDIDIAPSANDTTSENLQMSKMDRRQKLRIWQKAREEQRVQEEGSRATARPPFVVGKARSSFKTVEQFIKGPRRHVLSHRNSNLSHSAIAKKPSAFAPATTDRPSTVPTLQVVGEENTREQSASRQQQQQQQKEGDVSTANEEQDALASNFAPRSLHSVFEREQHAQDLTSMLVGLQVASPKPCQLSQHSNNDSSNTTITTTISAHEEASLLLDDAEMQEDDDSGARQEETSSTAQADNPVQRFINLHDNARVELISLCAVWRELLPEALVANSETEGEINRVIGQAELLLRKLMPKYLELCHNASNGTATVRLDDLQGYWDARVEAQVMDIKAMFKTLDEMRANGWKKKEATPEPAAPKKRRAKKKVVRKPRKTRASSGVAAFLAKKRAEKRSASTVSPQIELAVAPRTAIVAPQPVPLPELEKAAEAEARATSLAETTPDGVLQRRKHARIACDVEDDEEQERGAVSSGAAATATAHAPTTTTTAAAAAALLADTAATAAASSDEEGAAPVTPLYSGKRRSVCSGRRSNRSVLLTPVRASKMERENLGTEVVFTPVRRSRRTTPSKYRTRSSVVEFSQALEQPNFAYKPNPALVVRNHPDAAQHENKDANAEPVCTPLNASTRSLRRRRSSGVHNASGRALRALTPNSNLDALLTCETPQGTPARVSSVAPSPNVSRAQAAPSTPRPCTSTPLFLSARKRPSRAQPPLECIREGQEPSSPADSSSSRTTGVSAPLFDLLA